MKVLLDECVDHRFRFELSGHEVRTVPEMGWAGIKNGELLAVAAEHFDVMVTVDKRMAVKRSGEVLGLTVLVLHGRSTQLKHLKPLVPQLLANLSTPLAAKFYRIEE